MLGAIGRGIKAQNLIDCGYAGLWSLWKAGARRGGVLSQVRRHVRGKPHGRPLVGFPDGFVRFIPTEHLGICFP